MKAAERRSFKVDFCSGQEIALHNGFWDIAYELRFTNFKMKRIVSDRIWTNICRRQIFCVECGIDHQQEFVEEVEISSFHFIGICKLMSISSEYCASPFDTQHTHPAGNAPVGVGRYRVLLQPDGSAVALIDKVAMLADWRRRGIGKHMISGLLIRYLITQTTCLVVTLLIPCSPMFANRFSGTLAMANHARHLQSPTVRRITAQTGEGSLVTNKLDALGVPRDRQFGVEWGIVFDVTDFTSQLP